MKTLASFLGVAILPGLLACGDPVVQIGLLEGDGGTHDASVADSSPDGTRADGSNDTGPHDGSSMVDTGGPADSPVTPECPSSAPKAGADCPSVGLVCEYGSSATVACNQVATCSASGWKFAPPSSSGCAVGTCPAEYPSGEVGMACTSNDLVCSYAAGTCTCASSTPLTADTGGPHWQCFPKQSGCPTPRPKLGTKCGASAAAPCDYGACAGGIELVCEDGVWKESFVSCPG
jgi:hypothetical protein